jgi:hypothetical protein
VPPSATITPAQRERNIAAALTRFRDAADPELTRARTRMGEEKLVAAVQRALDKAAPLSEEVRQRIVGLLSVTPVSGASVTRDEGAA